jgi:hypothetical protein
MFQGVPYSLSGDPTGTAGLDVVVPADFAAVKANQTEAWALYRSLLALAQAAPDPLDFLTAFRFLLTNETGQDSGRDDKWSLMFIQFVRGIRPESYLSGEATLGDAFMESLLELVPGGPALDSEARKMKAVVLLRIFGTLSDSMAVVNLVPSHEMVFALIDGASEREKRILGLETFGATALTAGLVMAPMAGATALIAGVIVAELLPGIVSVAVLDFVLQAIIGYILFAMQLRELDERGVEADDQVGVWIAFASIFIPFIKFFEGTEFLYIGRGFAYLGKAVDLAGIAGIALTAITVLKYLCMTIESLWGALESLAAAAAAGWDDYAELDPAQTLFIPVD